MTTENILLKGMMDAYAVDFKLGGKLAFRIQGDTHLTVVIMEPEVTDLQTMKSALAPGLWGVDIQMIVRGKSTHYTGTVKQDDVVFKSNFPYSIPILIEGRRLSINFSLSTGGTKVELTEVTV